MEKCRTCKYFIPVFPETRMCLAEPAECGHPVVHGYTNLPSFPFKNGCKHFEPITLVPLQRIGVIT